jgi:outer membrane protein TolC
LTRRADVLAALADYAAAEATLRLEVAGQYPDLHLNPGYSLDAGENKWTLGIGLTLPILNHNEGAIGEAEAKRQETAAVFDSVQSRVLADYERSTLAYRAARVTAGSTETLLAEQIAQMDSEKRLLDAGAGDRTTLLSLEVERATTLTARLDAQIEVQSALGAIEEATQTPAL